MKLLNGRELAGFIKERQAKEVRTLRQQKRITPHLAIVRTNSDPVVNTYMRLKEMYGQDILVDVTVYNIEQSEALQTIENLNSDPSIHGIIVQIPLPDPTVTDDILNAVIPAKDVDGLNEEAIFDAPTPTAIAWLLSGYNIELMNKKIVIVGHGRLVGKPLFRIWQKCNYDVSVADKNTENLKELCQKADILVSATGKPGIITSDMVKEGAVVVDAGVATDSNGLIGDVAAEIRLRGDITITPESGGVGPLTVCALFDNVIRACAQQSKL